VPRYFELVEELPRTLSEKIDKPQLKLRGIGLARAAKEYARATKRGKGQILMIWSLSRVGPWPMPAARDQALQRKTLVRNAKRRPLRRTYGYDTLTALIRVWRWPACPRASISRRPWDCGCRNRRPAVS
jgi:hypothetical protein